MNSMNLFWIILMTIFKGDKMDNDENIHFDCENYNQKKDMCLKWFETNVSRLTECKEKTVFSDEDLQKKWSN